MVRQHESGVAADEVVIANLRAAMRLAKQVRAHDSVLVSFLARHASHACCGRLHSSHAPACISSSHLLLMAQVMAGFQPECFTRPQQVQLLQVRGKAAVC